MRFVLCAAFVVATTSSATADPAACTAGSECERACNATPAKGAACSAGADLYFDGRNSHPLDHAKSFALAKRGCDAGEGQACMLLGYHHQDGLGGPWDPKLAVAAYVKGCDKGFGTACYNLSGMYLGAHGVPLDKAKGEQYAKLARSAWEAQCKGSATRWCTNHGFALATAGDLANARKAHQRACDNGWRVGCVEAARVGLDMKAIDGPALLAELERQCKAGEPTGCTHRGYQFMTGKNGSKVDPARAAENFRKSCDLGDKMGCMAAAYQLIESKQDPAAALRYLNSACDRAHAAACNELSRLMGGAKRYPEAIGFAVRACRIGDAESCGFAGQNYVEGNGVAKDERKGIALLNDGCRMADMPSCGVLIRRNEELPVPDDMKQKLYASACKAGLKEACPRVKP
jgi:TPR repeat protein